MTPSGPLLPPLRDEDEIAAGLVRAFSLPVSDDQGDEINDETMQLVSFVHGVLHWVTGDDARVLQNPLTDNQTRVLKALMGETK